MNSFLMGHPRSLFRLFSSNPTNITILLQIYVKKCPSSIQCRDSNQWPSGHESPPITTRPGLLPKSHMTSLNQLECFISVQVLYDTGSVLHVSWHNYKILLYPVGWTDATFPFALSCVALQLYLGRTYVPNYMHWLNDPTYSSLIHWQVDPSKKL